MGSDRDEGKRRRERKSEKKRQRSKDEKRYSKGRSLERDRRSSYRDDETKRGARGEPPEGHRRDHRKRHDYRENDGSSRSSSSSSEKYRSRSRERDRRRERKEVRDETLSLSGHNMADDSTRFFFTELVNKLTNNRSEGNRFPMIGNVIPEFDPMNKNQTINNWLSKVEKCAKCTNGVMTKLYITPCRGSQVVVSSLANNVFFVGRMEN